MYFEALHSLLDNLEKLNRDDMFLYVFNKQSNVDKVIELNKIQLGKGQDEYGNQMDNYSDVSLDLFEKPFTSNPFYDSSGGDSVRLYDEGDFYKSIVFQSLTSSVLLWQGRTEFTGDDGESVNLTIFGDIIGLTMESVKDLVTFITPDCLEYVHSLAKSD